MNSKSLPFAKAIFAFILFVVNSPLHALDPWRDVTAEELSIESPVVDPEASVEFLFNDSLVSQHVKHWQISGFGRTYFRAKIFDEKGVEEFALQHVRYGDGAKIKEIASRTIKPDGTIIELDPETIYDTELEVSESRKTKAKAFAIPGLEPGDIVDIQYDLELPKGVWFLPMNFHLEHPCREVSYRFRPAEDPSLRLTMAAFQYPDAELKMKQGYYNFTLYNTPAEKDEPYKAPEIHTEPSVVLYYLFRSDGPEEDYWKIKGLNLNDETNKNFKANGDFKNKANSLVAGAGSDLEKLQKLYAFCQMEIVNRWDTWGALTSSEVDDLPENNNPADTLSSGSGTPHDIRYLFGAMAKAVGLKPKLAETTNKFNVLFNPAIKVPFFRNKSVYVEVDGQPIFLNPGDPVLPFGALNWWCQGVPSLIATNRKETFIDTQQQLADFTLSKRRAIVSIDEDGTLSGKLTLTYSGYRAIDLRNSYQYKTHEERVSSAKALITKHQPNANITEVTFENIKSSEEPLKIVFDVEIPNYADVVGKRIFVQPAIFHKGKEPVFEADERENDILFDYAWTESDYVAITIPDGFEIENGSVPESFDIPNVLDYQVQMGISKKSGKLIYRRNFALKYIHLAAGAYPALKQAFTKVNLADNHTVSFSKADELAQSNP